MDTKTLVAVTYDRKYNSPKILKVANFNNDYFKEDDLLTSLMTLMKNVILVYLKLI